MPQEKPRKIKSEKVYTRAQAERLLSHGADPNQFSKHGNYHVRRKAWTLLGQPLPEDAGERAKFLASINVKEKQPEPTANPVEEVSAAEVAP